MKEMTAEMFLIEEKLFMEGNTSEEPLRLPAGESLPQEGSPSNYIWDYTVD